MQRVVQLFQPFRTERRVVHVPRCGALQTEMEQRRSLRPRDYPGPEQQIGFQRSVSEASQKALQKGLLGHLNNLTKLEELCFDAHEELPVKLNLPNLKTLTLGYMGKELVLNTPKLESLDIIAFPYKLHVLHPDSIRFIKCSTLPHREDFEFLKI